MSVPPFEKYSLKIAGLLLLSFFVVASRAGEPELVLGARELGFFEGAGAGA